MPDKVKYEFSIIRIVPKVERQEFFNAGVILFSRAKKYLGVKYQIDPKKLACFSSEIDQETIETYLKAWGNVCDGSTKGGVIGDMDLPDRFRWLTASRSTIIQSSITHSGLCEDPEMELEKLFELFVL